MSKQPPRYAVIELVETETVWPTDQPIPSPSKRPHFLRLRAPNGQILSVSETFANKSNARRASDAWIEAFRDVMATPDTERVREVAS